MANLLPQEFSEKRSRASLARVLHLVGFTLLAPAAALLILYIPELLPSGEVVVKEEGIPESVVQKVTKELKESQQLVLALTPTVHQTHSVQDVLSAIRTSTPPGIIVTSYTYAAPTAKAGKGTLLLTGSTKSRSDIAAFRVALVRTNMFDTVSLPVDALVDVNAQLFTMTLTGAF